MDQSTTHGASRSASMAIINCKILTVSRLKEWGQHSKMFALENVTFIPDSKLHTHSITLHPPCFTVWSMSIHSNLWHVQTLLQDLEDTCSAVKSDTINVDLVNHTCTTLLTAKPVFQNASVYTQDRVSQHNATASTHHAINTSNLTN
jgi:hypothetical protein